MVENLNIHVYLHTIAKTLVSFCTANCLVYRKEASATKLKSFFCFLKSKTFASHFRGVSLSGDAQKTVHVKISQALVRQYLSTRCHFVPCQSMRTASARKTTTEIGWYFELESKSSSKNHFLEHGQFEHLFSSFWSTLFRGVSVLFNQI